MAQTKRKRRTKHRGNAAGMVESRGRTGAGASSNGKPQTAAQRRQVRFDRPPSWNAALTRAAITSILFGIVLAFVMKSETAQVIGMTGFMFLVYIPLGYYTDSFFYKRRQLKKAGAGKPR